MAIIYTYPQINSSSDLEASDLMIISDMSANGRPTKSLTLSDLATYVTNTGTGTGTTNKITKWTNGASGLLGDSSITDNGAVSMSVDFTVNSSGNNAKFTTDWGDHRISILDAVGAYTLTATDLDGGGKIGINKQNPSSTLHVGGTGTFDSSLTIPLIPSLNAHATSKQYVDQQISSIPAGLVFKGNWDASSTPGGNPNLTSAIYKVIGNYYVVSVAGSATPNGAGTLPDSWDVGDWCVYIEQGGTDRWEKLDQTFVQGSGAIGQVSFWNGINSVTGDNAFFWDNSNKRLGIGTTSPSSKLHVAADIRTDNSILFTGTGFINSNATNLELETVSNKDIILKPQGTGNVGIGTTSPLAKLQVSTASSGVAAVDTGTTAVLESDTTNYLRFTSPDAALAGLVWTSPSDNFGAFLRWSHTSQLLEMGTANSNDNISFSTGNASPAMYIKSSGEVGIGTSSPDKKLDVTVDASDDGVILQTVSGRKALEMLVDNGTNGQGKIHFYTGSNLLHGRIMADSNALNIEQLAADKDIIFKADDGSGGVTEYFRLDGGFASGGVVNTLFPDNSKVVVGNDADARFWHNGTNSFIQNITGDLEIQNYANDSDISFFNDDGSGGITEYFKLDGGDVRTIVSKPFRFIDSIAAEFGTGLDLQLYHSGGEGTFFNYTGNLRIIQGQDDGDITFLSDDGSGGVATYFFLDGSEVETGFLKTTHHYDNIQARFGDAGDLRIYHDGNSRFFNITGNLIFTQSVNDGDIQFFSDDGSGGTTEYFRIDGSSEYNIFSKDLYITDNVTLRIGTGQDLRIYHDGSNSYIDETGTGDLYIKAVDDIWMQSGTNVMSRFNSQGVKLYYLNVSKLETISSGVKLPEPGDGITLVSPDGNTTRTISIDNSGNLVVSP